MGRAPVRPNPAKDPAVIVDTDLRNAILWLDLCNRSDQPVREVKVAFKGKLFGMGGQVVISDLPIWTKLRFLPPGKQVSVPIDRARDYFARARTTFVSLTISYVDVDGEPWQASISHDLAAWQDFPEFL